MVIVSVVGKCPQICQNAFGLSSDQMDAEISVARGVRIVRVVRYEILVGMTDSHYGLKSLLNGRDLRDTPYCNEWLWSLFEFLMHLL